MNLDTAVKLNIYDTLARTTRPPTTVDVARSLGVPLSEVEAAFQQLHQKRLLVPEPGDPSRVRMAPPFSGVPTTFRVIIEGKTYFANCVWDAFGIPAALHRDAIVEASDGHTGEPMRLEVLHQRPVPEPCVAHFAVPSARWWQDIIYT